MFEFDGGKITCKEMSSAGELTELSSSILEMTPGTSSCTGFGSAAPGIDWNGCRMEYKASLDVGPPIRLTAKPGIRCPSTPTGQDEIVITVFESGVMKCSIHIPEQEVESGITLTNGEAKGVGDITMDHHIETLQYSQVAGEGLGKCANASGTKNGKYTGEITLTGRNGKGEATSIWAE